MPKPRKEENQDALGQVFDFIFTEAEKKPSKRRPIKPTGVSGKDSLTDALAAALEKPGVFLNEQILESLDEALDLKIGEVKYDDFGKVKISVGQLANLIKDPDKVFEAARTKSKTIRKTMRAQFASKMMQEMAVEAWARKHNLDLDAKDAIRGSYAVKRIRVGTDKKEVARGYQQVSALSSMSGGRFYPGSGFKNIEFSHEKQFVLGRGAEIIGKELFGEQQWNSLSSSQKDSLSKVLRETKVEVARRDEKKTLNPGDAEKILRDRFVSEYGGREGYALFNQYSRFRTNQLGKKSGLIDIDNEKEYRGLETYNIKKRVAQLESYKANHPNLSTVELANLEEGINNLQKAEVVIGDKLFDISDIKNSEKRIKDAIADFSSKSATARASNNMALVADYDKKIKIIKDAQREFGRTAGVLKFWGAVGTAEGYINSWNMVYKDNNAFVSILNGNFFDENKNKIFCPTMSGGFKNKDGDFFKIGLAGADKFNVAAKSKNALVNSYNKTMTNFYYLTPKSMMRTLFYNGEGFAYIAHKQWSSLNASITGVLKAQASPGVNIPDFNIDMDNLTDVGIQNILSQINDPKLQKLLGTQLKALKSTGNLTKFFSTNARLQAKVGNFLEQKIFKHMRSAIGKMIGGKLQGEAAELLGAWVLKGGLQTFARAVAIGIFNAVGIAVGGPVGKILTSLLAGVIVDVAFKAAKVGFQILLYVVAGIVGMVFLLSYSSQSKFNKNSYAYTKVVPGEVYTNPAFAGIAPIDGDETIGGLHPFSGGSLPDGVQCLVGAGSFTCSQGPFGSYSHQKVAAADLPRVQTFYAPNFCGTDNCVVTSVSDVTCSHDGQTFPAGGMVIFTATYGSTTYTFKLIHVYKDVSVGQKLEEGEAVADVISGADHTLIEGCSTGSHLHLEVKANGAAVNPRDVLTSSGSNGGFECTIGACPTN